MKKTDDEDSGVFHKMKKNSIPENNQDWNQEMTDQKEKKTYANAAVPPPFLPVALTVAGSDSGGGAGIQADLRTFAALGVFGASAITAATFQNPLEVCGVEALSPKAVAAQIRTVEKVLNISAAKTGMLFSEEIIRSVADALSGCRHEIVSDPVMVSTSGAKLLRDSAVEAVKSKILPLCTWTTPNLPEAEVLTGTRLDTPRKRRDAARRIYETWGCHVILKGGHVAEEDTGTADDIVCYGGDFYLLSSPRVASAPHADHGGTDAPQKPLQPFPHKRPAHMKHQVGRKELLRAQRFEHLDTPSPRHLRDELRQYEQRTAIGERPEVDV